MNALNRNSNATPAVELDGLTIKYGNHTAVNNLSFEMEPGSITGFIGPNGAGKTTTIRMLLGLIRSDAGVVEVAGNNPSNVGALIEGPAFYPALSARKNLRILAAHSGVETKQIDYVLKQVELTGRDDDSVKNYSLGMRQRLGIAAALLTDPQVLFLDEPTNGLDPQGILDMRSLLQKLASEGKSILVSSHLLSEIEQICDQLVVLKSGTKIFSGQISQLKQQQHSELKIRTEDSKDVAPLCEVLEKNDYTFSVDDLTIRVVASREEAGKVNYLSFQSGITLSEVSIEKEDLESTFLRMTSGEVAS